MQRQKVQSSNISSVGYNGMYRTLEIEFKNGNIYRYFEVPENIATKLFEAESIGKFFHKEIKLKYSYYKTDADDDCLDCIHHAPTINGPCPLEFTSSQNCPSKE